MTTKLLKPILIINRENGQVERVVETKEQVIGYYIFMYGDMAFREWIKNLANILGWQRDKLTDDDKGVTIILLELD